MISEIVSKDNGKLKKIRLLKQKKNRTKEKCFVIEGLRFVDYMLQNNPEVLEYIVVNHTFLKNNDAWNEMLMKVSSNVLSVTDEIFTGLSETASTQGIIAVVKDDMCYNLEEESLDLWIERLKVKNKGIIVVLDSVQDPGNLGTIIRTIDAMGINGLIINSGTVDPYNAKVLRSTMGSILNVPIALTKRLPDMMTILHERGFKSYCTSLESSKNFDEVVYDDKTIIVFGNEGNGVSQEVLDVAHQNIIIPMWGKSESLNVAVAAGIVMYEVKCQKAKNG